MKRALILITVLLLSYTLTDLFLNTALAATGAEKQQLCDSIGEAAASLHQLAQVTDKNTYTTFAVNHARSNAADSPELQQLLIAVADAVWTMRSGTEANARAQMYKICLENF